VRDGREALEILQQAAELPAAIFDLMSPTSRTGSHPYMNGMTLAFDTRGMITANDPKIWMIALRPERVCSAPTFTPPQVK